MKFALPAVIIIWIALFPNHVDLHRSHTYMGMLLLSAWLTWTVAKRTHWAVALAFASAAYSALMVFANTVSPHASMGGAAVTALDSISGYAFGFLVLMTVGVMELRRKATDQVLSAFVYLGMVEAGLMIFRFCTTPWARGIFEVTSLDAFFLACLLPLTFQRGGMFPMLLSLTAIVLSQSSTGLVGVVIATVSYFVASKEMRATRSLRILTFSVLLAVVGIGVWFTGLGTMVNPGGRLEIWKISMQYWSDNFNPWVGSGLGNYWYFGARYASSPEYGMPMWMHNDWLQVLFEQGIFGLASVVLLFGVMLWKALDRAWLFSSIATYGFCASLQMPLRLFFPALLGAVLVRRTFDEEEK